MQKTDWIEVGYARARFVLSRGKVYVEAEGQKGRVPYGDHVLSGKGKTLAVVSRDKRDIGVVCGAYTHCSLEGCSGRRIPVRWVSGGRLTRPCTKDMVGDGAVSWMYCG